MISYEKMVSVAWEQATEDNDTGMENRFRELVNQHTETIIDWQAVAIEAGLVGPNSPVPSGLDLIAQERKRQVEAEVWTPEHDNRNTSGELAIAAACYAMHSAWKQDAGIPLIWPWEDANWKPKDPISDLVRAGALIAAELDRILRLL